LTYISTENAQKPYQP